MKKEDRIGVQFGEEVSGKTIVGGRGTVRKPQPVPVPVGIEKVLYVAASDPGFRGKLLNRRDEALSEPRFGLSPMEREILSGVSSEQLAMMIDRIDPVEHGRRKFIQKVAIAALGLAAVTVDTTCGCSTGIGPEPTDGGPHPDASPICSDVHPCPDGGGSRPDAGDGSVICSEVHPCVDAGGSRPDAGPGDGSEGEDGATQPDAEQIDAAHDDAEITVDVPYSVDAGGARPDAGDGATIEVNEEEADPGQEEEI